ncbi:hypothetical protein FACS189494_08380 [Spirochaetia bacterium]|nr:hypothetical protein FACS189494_08380 [Spirochaetia bacterium]
MKKYFTVFKAVFTLMVLLFVSCNKSEVDNNTLMLFARAHDFYSSRRLKETVNLLQPKNTTKQAQNFVPILVLRGKAEYFLGNIQDAKKTFKRVLSIRPTQVESSLFLARIMREEGDVNGAEKIVKDLLADDSSNIRTLRFAAELSKDTQAVNSNTVMAYLNRAADASVESSLVFLDRARQHWIAGDGAMALDDLRCAKALITKDDPVFRAVDSLERNIFAALSKQ